MSEVQRINITLPRKLVRKSRVLIEEGLFSSFSELVRESIKTEMLLDQSLLEKKRILNKWFKQEEGSSYATSGLSQEELIGRIRKERDDLWDEMYEEWFEGLAN